MVIKVLYSQGFTGHRGPPIMQTAPIVTYVRVSTSGQGRSGLGIALCAAVTNWAMERRRGAGAGGVKTVQWLG